MDLAVAWEELAHDRGQKLVELANEIATLKTRLAMREQQLRESDAALAAEKAKVDVLCLVSVCAAVQRMALAERVGSTEPETAPEPWEAIIKAAIQWRRGADRGELAAAVDAFLGQNVGRQGSVAIVGGVLYPQKAEASDLAPRESATRPKDLTWGEVIGLIAGEPPKSDDRALRPEQYADGAGAQAWRQAMGGRPVEHDEDCTQYDPGCTNTCPVR